MTGKGTDEQHSADDFAASFDNNGSNIPFCSSSHVDARPFCLCTWLDDLDFGANRRSGRHLASALHLGTSFRHTT